ncbi:MAG: hypothetical protein WA964_10240 [Ilumatobacter sp.]|uniref:hypothetical protein n=1 Tax=Ilumatobacter sp. TaxID=1967498 RepID=UPI003C783DE6
MSLVIGALLLGSVGVVIAFGVVLALRSRQEFTEQNEVVPGRRSPAPASWAGAHSREAKLHRRLGEAVKAARSNPRFVELGLAAQTAAIEAEALAIDERLVAAAALPAAHRNAAIDPLEQHVVDLEATVVELVTSVSVSDSREQLEAAVSAADIKLQALAEARAEIELIDLRASGGDVVESTARPVDDVDQTLPPPQPGTATG